MFVRFALLIVLAFLPWTGMSTAAGSRVSIYEEPQMSECGDANGQGRSFDDPNVDTDPDRPIIEHASISDDEGDDQSDDFADGMCRSETLELWHQPEPNTFIQALAATAHAVS